MEKLTSVDQLGSPEALYAFAQQILLGPRAFMVDYRAVGGVVGKPRIELLTAVGGGTQAILRTENIDRGGIPIANDRELQEQLLRENGIPVRVVTPDCSYQIIFLTDEKRFVCSVLKPAILPGGGRGKIQSHEVTPAELKQCAQILFDIYRV